MLSKKFLSHGRILRIFPVNANGYLERFKLKPVVSSVKTMPHLLTAKVRPNSDQTAIQGILEDGTWKIDIAAPPEKGKANKELIRFLADRYGVPKINVEIISGHMASLKRIRITGVRSL